jgi:hypothetical protein
MNWSLFLDALSQKQMRVRAFDRKLKMKVAKLTFMNFCSQTLPFVKLSCAWKSLWPPFAFRLTAKLEADDAVNSSACL